VAFDLVGNLVLIYFVEDKMYIGFDGTNGAFEEGSE
jgi:hypothetical protein